MEQEEISTPAQEAPQKKKKSRKRLLWKIPLAIVSILGGLLILIMVASSIILTPSRLKKWVEEYGSEYLVDGRVEVGRVELTIWSSFPHVELNVKDLVIINENPEIPAEYSRVLSLEGLSGRLDVLSLLTNRIDVRHVRLERPEVTVWMGTDSINSFSIIPPDEDDEPLSLPDFRMSRFDIIGEGLVHYIAPQSDIDATFHIERSAMQAQGDALQYSLQVTGKLGPFAGIPFPLPVALDGELDWDPVHPMQIHLGNFTIDLGLFRSVFSMTADFTNELRIEALEILTEPLPLGYVADLARKLNGTVPEIESDAEISFKAVLNKPYVMAEGYPELPDLHLEVRIADGPAKIPAAGLNIANLGLELDADIAETGLDDSRIDVRRLNVRFPAADFTLTATATNLESDPALRACFKGSLNFSRMDPRLWTLLGMRLNGRLNADVDMNLRLSHLSPSSFHRARIEGNATLRDFSAILPGDSVTAGITRADFAFGTSRKFITDSYRADSLLTASLNVDSAWVNLPELTATLAGLRTGLGIENRASTADTTTVTPMGAHFSLRSLRCIAATDSARTLLRDVDGYLVLTRYLGNDRAPRISADLKARRIAYSDASTRFRLSDSEISAGGYFQRRQPRVLSPADSARRAARRDSMLLAASKADGIDFGVDRSTISLLRRWHINGTLSAGRARLSTPSFPLRMTMRDLDFAFNPDSLILRSLLLRAGQSDFALTGLISNMQRALGRRNGQPLRINLEIASDTVNVNELTRALFQGAAATAAVDSVPVIETEVIESEALEAETALADTAAVMAPVIPSNIDARLAFSARHMLYSTLPLRNFRGEILVGDGAANLRDLHAESDIGSLDLNMLYYAPSRSDVSVAMGLDLTRFNIGRVTEVLPALDSIMPILNTLSGVVDVEVTATTPVDSLLNVDMPRLKAMVSLSGDSLRLINEETFRTIGKWLMFKNKNRNLIDHMDVRLALEENMLSLYPFMFDFDRYRLGVMGHNDFDLNLDYHVSVLKSPLPFRFGINIKGTADNMKIRLGKARFKEEMAAQSVELSDTVRLNLAREIRNVFSRGAKAARLAPLQFSAPQPMPADSTLTTESPQ